MRRWLVLTPLLLLASCTDDDGNNSTVEGGMAEQGDDGEQNPANPHDDAAQHCVDVINMYRATINVAPLQRWIDAEVCSNEEAESDSMTGQAHGAFGSCEEFAQNECPGWPGPPEPMLDGCLELMWAEGPGEPFEEHGHYINMSNPDYTMVACGFHETADGSWWSVQNFR